MGDVDGTQRSERVRRGRNGRTAMIAALILVIGAAAVLWWQRQPLKAVQFQTATVGLGAVERTVSATGTVNPVLTVTVGSYVSGVIDKVLCDFNDMVKEGQICAQIDDRTYQSAVAQARANLDLGRAQLSKDQAALAYAKANYDRNQRMALSNTVSQDAAELAKSTYDQALAQIAVDQATIEQRQAALDAAKINLDYTQIRSPVAGTVILRNVTAGQTVAASLQTPTLFLIAQNLQQMQVDANVSESDIGQVKAGEDASFTVNAFAGREFRGTVRQVRQSPQSVQNVITYDVIIAVANPDLALKPGMTAAAKIVVASRKDVLRVPSRALRYQPSAAALAQIGQTEALPKGVSRLYIVREDRPVAVDVKTGLDDGTWTEVAGGGLAAGDAVILGEGAATPSSRTANLSRNLGFHP